MPRSARDDLDACLIASPTPSHPAFVRAALDAGLHVLCEKPLALDPEEAEDLGTRASRRGLVLQVGFWRRFSPPWVAAKELVAAGGIGTPLLVRLAQWDADPPPATFCDPAVSGGLAIDCGVHEYDLAEWLTGRRIRRVSAWALPLVEPAVGAAGDLDNLVAVLELDGGAVATVDLSRNARFGDDVRTEVLGSGGAVLVDALPTGRARAGTADGMRELPGSAADDVMAAGVVGQARAFAAAVRGGPVDVPGASASARATAVGRAVIEATGSAVPVEVGVMARRVVIHQDDVGMCHGANVAFVELSARGTVTSGSVMVPCPGFEEIAEWAAADASLDLGVHLTLTAEKTSYRWGPISGPPRSAGLTDPSGSLWRDVASVRRHADPAAVAVELRAQVDKALAAGIDVTHLDAHMGAAIAPEFCATYLELAEDYRLPVLLTATLDGYAPNGHLIGVTAEQYAPFVARAERAGVPIFDAVLETPWDRPPDEPALPHYEDMLDAVGDGLTFLALHPNAPGELEVIEPATAHIRTDEHELFGSPAWAAWLHAQGLELTGMRALRDELRATPSSS